MKQFVILLVLIFWGAVTIAACVFIIPAWILYEETDWFEFPEKMINKL